ncbi:MAG: hypothetical protein LBK99_21530 [Opitutaceae bacterium]|nr:hypothetical protein [Opitutaceae bacterium]
MPPGTTPTSHLAPPNPGTCQTPHTDLPLQSNASRTPHHTTRHHERDLSNNTP